jgi:hypothetical protein
MKFLLFLNMIFISSCLVDSYGSDLEDGCSVYSLSSSEVRGDSASVSTLPDSKTIIDDSSMSHADKIKAAAELSAAGNKREAEKIYRFVMNDLKASFVDRAIAMVRLRALGVIV